MKKHKVLYVIMIFVAIIAIIFVGLSFFGEKPIAYTVTFQDYNGSVLKTETVREGEPANAPEDPRRDGYQFFGWDKEFSNITCDLIVKAEYVQITDTAFAVEHVTIKQGTENAVVNVSIKNNPGILGMVLSVSYDENALALVACSNGVALSALSFQEPAAYKSGCSFVWYGSETGEVIDGEMLILTFEIADDAKPGTYPITISWNNRDIYDSNCDMVNPEVVQGGIVISD